MNDETKPRDFRQIQWDALLEEDCRHLIRLAIREDLNQGYDWTTVSLVPENGRGVAHIVNREPGVVAGLPAIPVVLDELECDLKWTATSVDGSQVEAGTRLGTLDGSARDLLTAERTILNLLGHMSGVATHAWRHTKEVEGTGARVYDTRKTHLGYRRLEKYSVRCGGGRNHRSGLYDAILIKDNHLAFAAGDERPSVADAVRTARRFLAETLPDGGSNMLIEVEVDTLEQLRDVLPASPNIVLLDNMSPATLASAVKLRDEMNADVQLEASGGVRLDTIRSIAESGVDRISVGALTHSARCLDIGLDWQTDP